MKTNTLNEIALRPGLHIVRDGIGWNVADNQGPIFRQPFIDAADLIDTIARDAMLSVPGEDVVLH